MSKCGKGCMPECEYFTTGGCISPFNCLYKIETGYINSATSVPTYMEQYNGMGDDNVKCLKAEIARLTAENVELRARLDKDGLPVKVGDTIYIVFLDEIKEWQVEKIELYKDEYSVYCGHADTDDYTFVTSKEYGMWWFTDPAKAEARLKELLGGRDETF